MFSNYCTDYFCLLIGKHRAHTIHIYLVTANTMHIHLVTANTMHIHLVTANRNANSKLVIAVQYFENMLWQSAQYNIVHSGRPLSFIEKTSTVPEQELRSYVCSSRGNFFLKDVEGVICRGMNIFLHGGATIFEFFFIF